MIILGKGLNSSIWPIDGTLTGSISSDQSGPEGNATESVLHINQTLLDWSLNIRCSLMLLTQYLSPVPFYLWHFFFLSLPSSKCQNTGFIFPLC